MAKCVLTGLVIVLMLGLLTGAASAANMAPVAKDDTYSGNKDSIITIGAPGVLSNDSDTDGDTLSAMIVSDPVYGTLTLNADGSFTYTPDTAADYTYPYSFTYKATDGSDDSNIATVTLHELNEDPIAVDDTVTVIEDTPVTLNLLLNDSDPNGDSLIITTVSDPDNGVAVIIDGLVRYTPDINYTGTDSFTYEISDRKGATAKATVAVTVSSHDDTGIMRETSMNQVTRQGTDIIVTKTVDPANIKVTGSSCYPQDASITITVTGYGGTVATSIPIDVVFAIDGSGSMDWNDPSNLRLSGAQLFIDQLDSNRDQVGVVAWDDAIIFTYPDPVGLTNDFTTAKTKIGTVPASGGTNGELGLQRSLAMLAANTRPDASTEVIILLTDGEFYSGCSQQSCFSDEIATATANNYKIYTIGLGDSVNTALLTYIATSTGGSYHHAASADDIANIYNEILTQIVLNTAPSYVNITEITQDYIVNEGSFSISPDSNNGDDTFTWMNVSRYVGNLDKYLNATETFTITFTLGSSQIGNLLEVDSSSAHVNYTSPSGILTSRSIPQAYLNVSSCVGNITGKKGKGACCPLEGFEISLIDRVTGTVIATDITGADGTFEFLSVPYGNYWLNETSTVLGWKQVTPNVSVTLDATNPDFYYLFINAEDKTCCVCPPTASFSYVKTGQKVQFTDTSTGPHAVRWIWFLGDGTISTEQNPQKIYKKQGMYTVRLYITWEDCDGVTYRWKSTSQRIRVP